MANTRKKFSCTNCMGLVKVPVKHLGKRIKCPKCDFVFRAGPKPTEESEIVAELDEDVNPSIPVAAFIDPAPAYVAPPAPTYAPPMQPLASSRPLPASRPATPYRSKMVKKPTNQRKEMTEFESNLQGSGIFLLVLPVIATVLPLVGLQLRRLAKLGEFAPLAAMFLGLIGVGMICYARRKQGDAPLLGSAAAMFVLVTGIGGFLLVSALSPSGDNGSDRFSDQYADDTINQPSTDAEEAMAKAKAAQDNFAEENERFRAEHAQSVRDQHNQMRADSDRMMQDAQDSHRQAMEQHRKAMQSMQGGFQSPPNIPPPNFSIEPPNFPRPNFGGGFGGRRN